MTAGNDAQDLEIHRLNNKISRLQRITKDLQESQEFSQALFQATQTGMLLIQMGTRQIMDANPAAADILGLDMEELVGESISRFVSFRNPEEDFLEPACCRVVNAPREILHADGHPIQVLLSVDRISGNNQGLLLLGFLDITAQKLAEDELKKSHQELSLALTELQQHKNHIVQSEKLASIGQLAAGVAHEINNPVGYVSSNLGTIQEYIETMRAVLELFKQLQDLPEGQAEQRDVLVSRINKIKEEEDLDFILEDIDNVLQESMEGVVRVAEIVQNLKSFAREDSSEKCFHDVNEGVEAMIKVVWNELKYCCNVEKNLGDIPPVEGHGGQINQVIMNMLVNAAHAMPEEGGQITVSTELVGEEVIISIADTGCGMSQETMARIFDPFFTTKDIGKGTGLGLSISHGIIEDHGGRIEVESEPGKGTTFRIHLPAASRPEENPTPAATPEEELIG